MDYLKLIFKEMHTLFGCQILFLILDLASLEDIVASPRVLFYCSLAYSRKYILNAKSEQMPNNKTITEYSKNKGKVI
jgi:hypothetical protein